jgi:uncharacterized protein involved in type VI secretion and phage assembly
MGKTPSPELSPSPEPLPVPGPDDDDLPDTSREDEIARLQHELAEARQRAATAEAKLAAVESGAKITLTKLQREMLNAGFKALAKSADKGMKQALTDAKNSLLK